MSRCITMEQKQCHPIPELQSMTTLRSPPANSIRMSRLFQWLLVCSRVPRGLTQVQRVSPVCSNLSLADVDLRCSFLRMEINTNMALEAEYVRTWPPLCDCCCPALAWMLSSAAFCLSEPTSSAAQHSMDVLSAGCPPLLWMQERGATLFFSTDSSKHPQVLLRVQGLSPCVKGILDLSPGMSHITSRLAYGHGQLTSHDWSLFRSSTSNWHDLLYQLTVQIQICFTNKYTFCFSNQLFMFCSPPLIHSTTVGPTLSIGVSPFSKCQAKKCKNPVNLLAPLVGRPHVAVGF